ncbi:MAG TPA: copper resistance protein CopC [Rhodopila sp.]|nr:copper resistance protein CopC [Rhodopila sp.]
MRRLLILVSPILAGTCLTAPPALAHAMLDHATPPVGSAGPAPASVSLRYTEPVEPLFSTVSVTNAKGDRVDDGKPKPDADGRILVVPLKQLPPGTYNVEWHVTSVDTHKTEGHFSFTVKP